MKVIKVRTLTFHRVLNYGAVLQAYALCKFLNSLGYDAKVVDYLPYYFALQTYRPSKGFRKSIDKLKKIMKFRSFRKDFLPMTDKTYFSVGGLNSACNVNAYICGSDQVWNYRLTDGVYDRGFFLDFEVGNAKRIAFAASAGGESIEGADDVGRYLSSFDAIGVRESLLADQLMALPDLVDSRVVVDPTLLLESYSEIANYNVLPEGDFLLTYVVGSGNTLELFDSYVREIKKTCSLPIVHVGSKNIDSADMSVLDIGPREWVAFFERASFIVTNSFHGTAFAINFKKQFLFVPHGKTQLNQRQYTLLGNVGLMCRCVDNLSVVPSLKNLEPIDYNKVSPVLRDIVDSSKKFLVDSLGDCHGD